MKKDVFASYERGFTLIELIIFSALFLVASVIFLTILVSVTRVHVRQNAASEVNQQSLFLLQTVQRYIEESSLVDMPTDAKLSTLTLRMPSQAIDPTEIYLNTTDKRVYLRQAASGIDQPLTTDKVGVTKLEFVKRSNVVATSTAPSHESVSIVLTMEFSTVKPQETFSQTLASAVARVNAATFETDVLPPASNPSGIKVGASGAPWKSINETLFFSGSNVGIGSTRQNPTQALEIDGGILFAPSLSRPATCDSSKRGLIWFDFAGATASDTLSVCIKKDDGSYSWVKTFLQ